MISYQKMDIIVSILYEEFQENNPAPDSREKRKEWEKERFRYIEQRRIKFECNEEEADALIASHADKKNEKKEAKEGRIKSAVKRTKRFFTGRST